MLLALPHDLTLLVVEHILQAHSLCALEAGCKALCYVCLDHESNRAAAVAGQVEEAHLEPRRGAFLQ